MPVAKIEPINRKKTSLVLTILVLSTGLISAFVFVVLNRNQAPQTPAATLSCPATGAYCEWKDTQEGVSYEYKVVDTTNGATKMTGRINGKRVNFDFRPDVGHTYRCSVTVVNACGRNEKSAPTTCSGSSTSTTGLVTATVTPVMTTTSGGGTPTSTPSATLMPKSGSINQATGVSPTATPSGTLTPTKTPTPTPTKAGGTGGSALSGTPTPTTILIVQATNTPGPSPTTASVASSQSATNAPSQSTTSLPQAGIIAPSLAIFFFAAMVILFGLVF